MPVREEALRRRQHAKTAGRIYRQRRRLAERGFVRAREKRGNLTPEQAEKKMAEWKTHSTALLLDPDGKAGQAYGAKNTPHMFVINPEGKIIYEGAIDSKASPNPADIPSSTNYVKVALDEALAGKTVSNPTTRPLGCSVSLQKTPWPSYRLVWRRFVFERD